MASRKILEISKGKYVARVYRDRETEEYHARLFVGKVERESARYFTDDPVDAQITAGLMVRSAYQRGQWNESGAM